MPEYKIKKVSGKLFKPYEKKIQKATRPVQATRLFEGWPHFYRAELMPVLRNWLESFLFFQFAQQFPLSILRQSLHNQQSCHSLGIQPHRHLEHRNHKEQYMSIPKKSTIQRKMYSI